MTKINLIIASFIVLVMGPVGSVEAAEIKILSAGSLKLAMMDLIPAFQKASGHTVTIDYNTAGAVAGRIQAGEPADVVIVSRVQLEKLEGQGRVAPGSRVNVAGVGVGVAVRKGAPKPDISSVEAFKRTLSAAKSIGYVDPALGSSSGIYVAGLLERLGLSQSLEPKIKRVRLEGEIEEVFQGVAKGEIEMQIGQITEIVISPGVDFAGPLPPELQNTTFLAAGVVTTSKAPEAAKALIEFISSPASAAVLKAKGFERG